MRLFNWTRFAALAILTSVSVGAEQRGPVGGTGPMSAHFEGYHVFLAAADKGEEVPGDLGLVSAPPRRHVAAVLLRFERDATGPSSWAQPENLETNGRYKGTIDNLEVRLVDSAGEEWHAHNPSLVVPAYGVPQNVSAGETLVFLDRKGLRGEAVFVFTLPQETELADLRLRIRESELSLLGRVPVEPPSAASRSVEYRGYTASAGSPTKMEATRKGHYVLRVPLRFEREKSPRPEERWSEDRWARICRLAVSLHGADGRRYVPVPTVRLGGIHARFRFDKKRKEGTANLHFVIPEDVEPRSLALRLHDRYLQVPDPE